MTEYELFETLKESYYSSTTNNNRFENRINSIVWDNIYKADCETHFVKGGFTLSVENINPFIENWKPTGFFSDGAVLEF